MAYDHRHVAEIAISQSRTISMGDGLTAELKDYRRYLMGPQTELWVIK